MKKSKLLTLTLGVVVVGVLAVVAFSYGGNKCCRGRCVMKCKQPTTAPAECKKCTHCPKTYQCRRKCTSQLATAPADKCRKMCTTQPSTQPAEKAQDGFVNTRCPIMGSPIDPAKVTQNLTREFNGKKVAFCCGGCPSAWDKLSDEQKLEKLDAAR